MWTCLYKVNYQLRSIDTKKHQQRRKSEHKKSNFASVNFTLWNVHKQRSKPFYIL